MNDDIVKAHWNEIKGKIKKQWGRLTDDDIAYMDGSYRELLGNLQKRYGYGKEQLKKEIDSFFYALEEDVGDLSEDFNNIKAKAFEVRDAVSQASQHVQGRAQDMLRDSVKDIQDKGTELQDDVVTYIKNNPTKSIAYGILAGILAAHLLRK